MIWSILDDSEDFICSKRNTFVLQNSEAKHVDHYHKVLSTSVFSMLGVKKIMIELQRSCHPYLL